MQLQINIGFEQLVSIAKKLPLKKWEKLKSAVEQEKNSSTIDLENLLLNAPTFSEEQIAKISKAREEINQWRKK